jgi:hypothetical protein
MTTRLKTTADRTARPAADRTFVYIRRRCSGAIMLPVPEKRKDPLTVELLAKLLRRETGQHEARGLARNVDAVPVEAAAAEGEADRA